MLAESRVRIGLLCGSLTARQRREVGDATANGEIDLLVGTQALLHGQIEFQRLGLCVIDEQHKFGVAAKVCGETKAACMRVATGAGDCLVANTHHAGASSEVPLISIDVMPTLLSLAGVSHDGPALDGVDFFAAAAPRTAVAAPATVLGFALQ